MPLFIGLLSHSSVATLIIKMMRFCPKCGDYYADASLAFCLGDGTPLVNVNPLSESWSEEGTRVIEAKENALRKQKRKLKWRRVVLTAMTMLIATMIVCVVAVNSFIYLKPQPEENVLNVSLTPTPTPSPAPTPTPPPTPTPTLTPTPTPTPTPMPLCSDAYKSREREVIINKFGDVWQRKIEGDRRRIIAENSPPHAVNVEASLGTPEYETMFVETCATVSVKMRYAWQVRANVNGTIKVATVAQEKSFRCVKSGDAWKCN